MVSLRILAGAVLLAVPLAILPAQGAAPQKFAYVDSRYIVNNAPGTPLAQGVLQREGTAMEAVAKRMSDSLDVLTTAFTKQQATLSAEKRDVQVKLITDRQAEYQQRYQGLQQQAQDRQEEVMAPILDQIKLAMEDIRVEMSLTMIFDVAQTGAIVATDKNLNISDRVLAKLRTMPMPVIGTKAADATAKGANAPPAGAPVSAPAGIRPPGSKVPPAARPDSTSKVDSTGKRPDSTTRKVPPR